MLIAQLEESNVVPLVDLPSIRAIPVSLAADGIAIKPGLQFDTCVKNLVGLLFPVDLNYVKMNPSPEPESNFLENVERKKVNYCLSDLNKLLRDHDLTSLLSVIAAANDMLMVTDSDSHDVYQVDIANNGACLQKRFNLLLRLPVNLQPFGLAFDGNSFYIGDLGNDGGITKFNLATFQAVMIVKNGSPDCQIVHGLDYTGDGKIIFANRGSRVV